MESPATGGLREVRLQAVRIQVEAEPGPEQPEHDSGQGNNVS